MVLLTGMQLVQPNMGSDEAMDSDVDDSNGPNTTEFYNINPGIHIPNVDAGLHYKVLSIAWNDVKATNIGSYNKVQWTVNSDVVVSYYSVEASVDGTDDFQEIGKILADENSSNYELDDYNILEGSEFYYRIKQYDINGGFTYSKIVSVIVDSNLNGPSFKIYPNPVVNELIIDVNLNSNVEQLTIDIYDKLGRLIEDNIIEDSNVNVSSKEYKINTSNLPEGIYNIRVNMDDQFMLKKMIVVKN